MTELLIAVLLFLLMPLAASAQTPADDWDETMQQLADELSDEADGDAWEAQTQQLYDLHEHPLDLNSATKTQLMQLPFLDADAADALLDYRAANGPLRAMSELLLVRGIGQRELRWLRLFATVAVQEPQADPRRRLRQEFTTRFDLPLYERDGWPWARGIAHRWRYAVRQGAWEAGLRGEKDAGEMLFTREQPLWDDLGGFVALREKGCLRTAVVGDYKVAFGEGVIANQGWGFGKMTTGFWRNSQTVRPHRSNDEVAYMRGAAADIAIGRGAVLTAFASLRRTDATLNADGSAATLVTTGYHRTDTERDRRHNTWSHTAGMHAAWELRRLRLGATAVWQHYDRYLEPGSALYRQIYPRGRHFANVGIDYAWHTPWLILRGETARSFAEGRGGWATLNRAALRFSPNTQVAVIQRFYSYNYFSPHARAFGEGSRVQNESGVCLMAEADRVGSFALRGYVDVFHSPWPRYTMTRASTGWEAMAHVAYSPSSRHKAQLRYRFRSKESSDIRAADHHLRAAYAWQLTPRWRIAANAFVHRHAAPDGASTGLALAPRADYGTADQRFATSLSAMFFRADDYDCRITTYEPTLASAFGLQQLYGRGQRFVATARLRLGRRLYLQAKLGATHYSDRTAISSGPLRIDSPWKTDVWLLLRIR